MENTSNTASAAPAPTSRTVRTVRRRDGQELYKLGALNTYANASLYLGSLKVHLRRYIPPQESRYGDYTPTPAGIALSIPEFLDLATSIPTIANRLLALRPRRDYVGPLEALSTLTPAQAESPAVADASTSYISPEDELSPLEIAFLSDNEIGEELSTTTTLSLIHI